jgi:RND family efflux transporter MFP subunit
MKTRLHKAGYILGRIIAPILILALGVGGLLVFGQKPEKEEQAIEAAQPTLVEVVPAESFQGSFDIEVEGVSLPLRQVQTSARVAGQVTSKSPQCRGGHFVQAGAELITIDSTDYTLEVERLQVQLEQAEENIAATEVDIANTQELIKLATEDVTLQQRNLKRFENLDGRGASTDAALDEARRLELTSRNALQTLQNELKSHQQQKQTLAAARKLAATQLKRAQTDLERTRVTAPVSGTIVTTDVEEGDYVMVGDPLFRINDTDDMEISCQLRVEDLYWIWMQAGSFDGDATGSDEMVFEIPRTPVEVAFEFKGVEYLWEGKLSRYDGTGLDPATRTIPCRVLVEDPTHVQVGGDARRGLVAPPTLFSGMYVKVRIPVNPPIPLVKVPTSAVQPGGEVWLARQGVLDIQPVTLARLNGTGALLMPTADGPQPGDSVIVSPLAGPMQGMPVQPIGLDTPPEQVAVGQSPEVTDEVAAEASR